MARVSDSVLKTYFETGDVPTQDQFASLIDSKLNRVATISDLISLSNPQDGDTVYVEGYHTAGDGGGGVFRYDASESKANHNGGTIIDPTQTFPTNWSDTNQQSTWFTASGSGTGCWVRVVGSEPAYPEWFGAKGDATTDDALPIQKAVASNKRVVFVALYYITSSINHANGAVFEGLGSDKLNGGTISGLKTDQDIPIIVKTNGVGGRIEGLHIIGNNTGTLQHGIKIEGTGTTRAGQVVIRDVFVENLGGNGIDITQCDFVSVYSTKAYNVTGHFIKVNKSPGGNPSTGLSFFGIHSRVTIGNSGQIKLDDCVDSYFFGLDFSSGSGPGIEITNGKDLSFFGGHVEFANPNILINPTLANGESVSNVLFSGLSIYQNQGVRYFVEIGGDGSVSDIEFRNLQFTWQSIDPNTYIRVSNTNTSNIKFTRCAGINYSKVWSNSDDVIFEGFNNISTFADGDTTPNVLGYSIFKTNNTTATSITTFDGTGLSYVGVGKRITIIFGDANTTIVHNAATSFPILLKGGVNVTPAANTVMSFIFDGTYWYEE